MEEGNISDIGTGTIEGDLSNNSGVTASSMTAKSWGLESFYTDKGVNQEAVEGLKESPFRSFVSKYTSPDAAIKGLTSLQQMANDHHPERPTEDAPQEVKDRFMAYRNKMNGVPEKIEDYGVRKPDELPDEQWDQSRLDSYMSVLHKHGASPEMVKDLVGMDLEQGASYLEQQKAEAVHQKETSIAELRQELGADADRCIQDAQKAAEALGLVTPEEGFLNTKLTVKDYVKMMAEAYKFMGEDKMQKAVMDGDTSAAGELKARWTAIESGSNQSDPTTADMWSGDPKREQLAAAVIMGLREQYEKLTRR